MDGQKRPGDVAVSRCNGTKDVYAIGEYVLGPTGELTWKRDAIDFRIGRDSAIRRGYERLTADHKVWLFDGIRWQDESCVEAPPPETD
jgi:hypothetical protein